MFFLLQTTAIVSAWGRRVRAGLPPVTPPTGEEITLANVERLYTDPTTRGMQGAPNKVVGVDPLPSGASLSNGAVTWTGDIDWGANGDQWDFNGNRLAIRSTATGRLRNALIWQPEGTDWNSTVDVWDEGADITSIDWCTFRGAGSGASMGSVIKHRVSGSGGAATAPRVALTERCAFFNYGSDGIKSTSGGIIRFNYFDTPANLAYEPPVWQSGDVYNTDEIATDPTGSFVFISLVDNNTTQPPGSKTSTAEWRNRDPHADQINPYAVIGGGLEIYGNYLNMRNSARLEGAPGFGWGLNNNLRLIRNTGTDYPYNRVYAHHNVTVSAGGNAYPVQLDSGGDALFTGTEVSENWIEPNGNGLSIHPNWTNDPDNVFQNNIEYTPTFGAGGGGGSRSVHGALGQSEIHQFLSPDQVYDQQGTDPLADETNLRVWLQEADLNGGAPIAYDVTEANVTANNINPALAALSNFLAKNAPGVQFGLADLAVAGTGFDALVDDTATSRSFADLQSVVDAVRSEGLEISDVHWWWYNSTAASIKSFSRDFSPGFLGQTDDGATFTLGTVHTDSVRQPQVDHTLWDGDAAAGSAGRGVFTRADTKISFIGPMPFSSDVDGRGELRNFSTDSVGSTNIGRIKQLDKGAWEAVEAFSQKPIVQEFHRTNTPGGHLVNFGGPTGHTHPDVTSPAGTPQVAYLMGVSMLKAIGQNIGQPQIIGIRPDGTDAKIVRVDISLPNGGVLTTPAAIMGTVDPAGIPHHHQVMGFELGRSGDSDTARRPIWNAAAARDAAYTGAVVIEDSGTGTGANRKGVVRIAMDQPLTDGAFLEFLRGGRTAVLETPRDHTAEVWNWLPVEYVADMDPGGNFPFFGLAVRSQPDTLVIAGAAEVVDPPQPDPEPVTTAGRTTKTQDAFIEGPTLDASYRGLTVAFTGLTVPVAAGTGAETVIELFEYQSNTFRIEAMAGSADRRLRIATEGGGVNGSGFTTSTSAAGDFTTSKANFTVTATLDDGTGQQRWAFYRNNVLVFSATPIPSPASTEFSQGRTLELFRSLGIFSVEQVRVFGGYTPDGALAGLALIHTLDAKDFNAPTAPLKLSGVDTFTLT